MRKLVTVSQQQFFAYVGPRDIVLSTRPNETIWETRNRTMVGRSTPGYLGGTSKTWELTKEAYEASR